METLRVRDISGIIGSKPQTILCLGERVFEVLEVKSRAGMFVDFVDKDGKVCRLYVRAFSKKTPFLTRWND